MVGVVLVIRVGLGPFSCLGECRLPLAAVGIKAHK